MESKPTLEERFWAKVDRRGPDDCWPWTSTATFRNGYGAFSIRHGQLIGAHRMAWTLTNGEIPAGQLVLHHCDNPPCCNPRHLFVGSYADNAQDKTKKGRHHVQIDPSRVAGEQNPRAKLTREQVAEIRARYRNGESQVALAVVFPVSRSMIGYIVREEAWES